MQLFPSIVDLIQERKKKGCGELRIAKMRKDNDRSKHHPAGCLTMDRYAWTGTRGFSLVFSMESVQDV